MKKILLPIILGAFVFGGCQTTTVSPIASTSNIKISRSDNVYIVTPRDGSYGSTQYTGSGTGVATALEAAFSRYASDAIVGPYADSVASALDAAREKSCSYVVIPRITHWEDRATEWSGRRDKLGLFVRVVRVTDGTEIKSAEISGKSSWFTFGGDKPQDLLREPIAVFVASVCQ